MAHQCSKCGKGPQMGNSVTHRGKAKHLGGVGTKITGITRRQFKPNLQRIRVTENSSTKPNLGMHPVHPQRRRGQSGSKRSVPSADRKGRKEVAAHPAAFPAPLFLLIPSGAPYESFAR